MNKVFNWLFLSSFDEWLATQNERKTRIWSTCKKHRMPVTNKYKTPPSHLRMDSKYFFYCTNLKAGSTTLNSLFSEENKIRFKG